MVVGTYKVEMPAVLFSLLLLFIIPLTNLHYNSNYLLPCILVIPSGLTLV